MSRYGVIFSVLSWALWAVLFAFFGYHTFEAIQNSVPVGKIQELLVRQVQGQVNQLLGTAIPYSMAKLISYICFAFLIVRLVIWAFQRRKAYSGI